MARPRFHVDSSKRRWLRWPLRAHDHDCPMTALKPKENPDRVPLIDSCEGAFLPTRFCAGELFFVAHGSSGAGSSSSPGSTVLENSSLALTRLILYLTSRAAGSSSSGGKLRPIATSEDSVRLGR